MDIEQAIRVIEQVTGDFKGTRQDHVQIQQALEAIKEAIQKKESKKA